MTFKEQREVLAELGALIAFYSRPESVVLPRPTFDQWDTISNYEFNGDKYENNIEKSKAQLQKIVRVLGTSTKDWDSSSLRVTKKVGTATLTFSISREAFCTKVATGETRTIPAVEAQPEREEPVYEWVCEDKSILA